MEVKQRNYFRDEYPHLTLDSLYNGESEAISKLDYILEAIITTEAPITLNLLKERLREVFDIKKISQKALDIIQQELNKIGFPTSKELFDTVYWSLDGYYLPKYVRISNRTIYDIPKEELSLVMEQYLNSDEETIFRKTLEFFGYEALTEKAKAHLNYILNYIRNEK